MADSVRTTPRERFLIRYDTAPAYPRRSYQVHRVRRINGVVMEAPDQYDWTQKVYKSVWEASAEDLLRAGWGDIPRHDIPYNWTRVSGGCPR